MKSLFPSIVCISAMVTGLPAAAADWDPAAIGHELSNGQAPHALEATRARLADQPDDPEAQFLQAMALAETGDGSGAIELYRKLSEQYPKRARIWNNLGVLYARQGRLNQARDALRHAIESEPGYATASANLGDVYVALAREAYQQAQQQGADADTMRHRRSALDSLIPSLPSTPGSSAASSPQPTAASPVAVGRMDEGVADKTAADDSTPAATDQAIDQLLSRWAKAWSNQDVSAYLAVYSDNYQPPAETSRAQWIRQQHARVTQPKSVAVSVSDVQVTAASADRVRATFHEHYRSADSDRDATRHMVFVHEDGAWRIRRES